MISFSAPLQKVVSSLRSHPWYVLLLVAIQFFFLFSIGFVGLSYQAHVLENLQTISTLMNSANLDEQQLLEGNAFLEQTLTLYSAYKALLKNTITLFIGVVLLFILFQALLWTLSHHLISDKLRSWGQWFTLFGKYCLSTLAFMIPLLIIVGLLLFLFVRYEFTSSTIGTFSNIIVAVAIILYYFLLMTWALLPLISLRQLPRQWLSLGVHKAYIFFPLIVLLHGFVILWGYLIYILMNDNSPFLLILLATFLFIFSFLLTRLYFIQLVNNYHDHHNSH